MLLAGNRKGIPAHKSSATTVSRSLLLGTGLTWSDLTWRNSGKMGRLNENRVREAVIDDIVLLLCFSTVNTRVDEWMPYPKEAYGVIAPEALIGLRVTPLSDIYGLAVTLWEVLHG